MRALSASVWTSPQLQPEALPALAQAGVQRVINNRPDDEEQGQPSAADVEASALAAGLEYVWIPISGLPTPDQATEVAEALADDRPTVMFCRSGMRSAAVWAIARARAGDDPASLREAAANAGYDLSRLPL